MRRSTSLYLDGLRFVAAMLVFFFHGGHFSGVRLPIVGNLGEEAVVIFFVLSGLVIDYTAQKKHANATEYLIARLARLWSVALPALALTLVSDLLGQALDRGAYGALQPLSAWKWGAVIIANASFLNQVWTLDISPGSNGPFWSLSHEFWYYMLFAAAFYYRGKQRLMLLGGAALIAGPKILLDLPIWLIGVAVHRALRAAPLPRAAGCVAWIGSVAGLGALYASGGLEYLRSLIPPSSLVPNGREALPAACIFGLLVAANVLGFDAMAEVFEAVTARIAGIVRKCAEMSFSLYLFHYPMMILAKAACTAAGLPNAPSAFIVYAAPLSLIAAAAPLWENLKDKMATWMRRGRADDVTANQLRDSPGEVAGDIVDRLIDRPQLRAGRSTP